MSSEVPSPASTEGQLVPPFVAKNLHRKTDPFFGRLASFIMKNNQPLTIEEVAAILRRTPKTVRSYCAAREIRASKVGGIWFIHRAAFERQFGQHDPSPNRKGA